MGSRIFSRSVCSLAALLLLSIAVATRFPNTSAQSPAPVLFSDPESTRAIAIDSVKKKHEPFSAVELVSFSADNTTRIMLVAGNLGLASDETVSAVTADAEDESHHIYAL